MTSDAEQFARQAVSLSGKARLYERAVASEAWVIKLQERIVDRDGYISALENELALSRGRARRLEKVLKRAMPYLFNGTEGDMEEIWRQASDLLTRSDH